MRHEIAHINRAAPADSSVIDMLDVEMAIDRRGWMSDRETFNRLWRAELAANPEGMDSLDTRRVFRSSWIEEMTRRGEVALSPLTDLITSKGIEIVQVHPLSGTLRVRVAAGEVEQLSALSLVNRIGLHVDENGDDGAGYSANVTGPRLDGLELEDLLQTADFTSAGFDGQGSTLGIVETYAHKIHRAHWGFGGRVENCMWVWPFGCTPTNPTNSGSHGDHATAVASIAIGSILNGEDVGITNSLERRKRSGLATGASAFGVSSANESFAASSLLSHGTEISSHSWGLEADDPNCTGTTVKAQRWNSLFEAGHAVITSSGNEGNASASDCTTKNPGTGVGVLTVGAYEVTGSSAGTSSTQMYPITSRGGTLWEGGGRSIVDIAGPSRMEFPYPHYQWPLDSSSQQYFYGADWSIHDPLVSAPGPYGFCCTSAATPAVSGALTVYRDWYSSQISSSIADPGNLFAQALLMGDASRSSDNSYRSASWDPMWGAGKLRLRKFDEPGGLGAPNKWSTGKVCVGHNQSTYITVSNSMPNGVDILKAVMFHYDSNHDTGGVLDDIDISLQRKQSSSSTWNTVRQDVNRDHKKRVIVENPNAGQEWRLRLKGTNVPSVNQFPTTCGTLYVMVNYAYMYESDSRPTGSVYRTERWAE